MTLVEAVLSEQHHLIKQLIGDLGVNAALRRSLHKYAAMLLHLRYFFLAHGPAQKIRFSKGVAGQVLRDAHDLLLVHHDSVGLAQNRLQGAVGEVDCLPAMFAVDELWNQACIEWAWSVESQDRGDVFQG
ncbi:MAG: Uncharacterised protein [Cyanobium sp. ARS6]|nr:MAG: Uncharacterised protein [Cyanobium sp. ARS6]